MQKLPADSSKGRPGHRWSSRKAVFGRGLRAAVVGFMAIGCSSAPKPSGGTQTAAPKPPGGFQPAAHLAYPLVPTGGGSTFASTDVVTVSFSGDSHTGDLTGFVDWLCQSGWLPSTAGEYGVQSVRHRAHVDLPDTPAAYLTDDDVRTLLTSKIGDGTIPSGAASGRSLLYVLFYPDGTTIAHGDDDGCSDNPGNGYHDSVDPSGPAYAVMPSCYPRFTASEVVGMELDTARVLVDALTDPSPRDEPAYVLTDNSWTSLGAEVGDFCWGRTVLQVPGYELQRVWSNKAAAAGGEPCVPVPAGSVAFGMTAMPAGLQKLQVGVPFTFTVTGWSEAPVADWSIQAWHWFGDFDAQADLDRSRLNNGKTAAVTVTVPYSVPSGTYGAVRVEALSGGDSPTWPMAFTVE